MNSSLHSASTYATKPLRFAGQQAQITFSQADKQALLQSKEDSDRSAELTPISLFAHICEDLGMRCWPTYDRMSRQQGAGFSNQTIDTAVIHATWQTYLKSDFWGSLMEQLTILQEPLVLRNGSEWKLTPKGVECGKKMVDTANQLYQSHGLGPQTNILNAFQKICGA